MIVRLNLYDRCDDPCGTVLFDWHGIGSHKAPQVLIYENRAFVMIEPGVYRERDAKRIGSLVGAIE